jgi:hypothetical protein
MFSLILASLFLYLGNAMRVTELHPYNAMYREITFTSIQRGVHNTVEHDVLFADVPHITEKKCQLHVNKNDRVKPIQDCDTYFNNPIDAWVKLSTADYSSPGEFPVSYHVKGRYYSLKPPTPLIINAQVFLTNYCFYTMFYDRSKLPMEYDDAIYMCSGNPICTMIIQKRIFLKSNSHIYLMGYGKPYKCNERKTVIWTNLEIFKSWNLS